MGQSPDSKVNLKQVKFEQCHVYESEFVPVRRNTASTGMYVVCRRPVNTGTGSSFQMALGFIFGFVVHHLQIRDSESRSNAQHRLD
jgi:hypothetical protein